MLNGSIGFAAGVKGNGFTFPKFEYNPNVANVVKAEIEGQDGRSIRCTVHLTNVPSEENGQKLAWSVFDSALNRIAYYQEASISNECVTGVSFIPVDGNKGVVTVSLQMSWNVEASVVKAVTEASLKPQLEQAATLGEVNFGMFRSALNSTGPVEAFMSLYHILLVLFADEQKCVDSFILSKEPDVQQTVHPKKAKAGIKETIYSRLRNELAHKRNVDMAKTKKEMVSRLGGLVTITKQAIELRL